MMKKASVLSNRGPRRKQTANGPNTPSSEERVDTTDDFQIETVQPQPVKMQHHHDNRRKPSKEEAALTSKNYRLAKELVSNGCLLSFCVSCGSIQAKLLLCLGKRLAQLWFVRFTPVIYCRVIYGYGTVRSARM